MRLAGGYSGLAVFIGMLLLAHVQMARPAGFPTYEQAVEASSVEWGGRRCGCLFAFPWMPDPRTTGSR